LGSHFGQDSCFSWCCGSWFTEFSFYLVFENHTSQNSINRSSLMEHAVPILIYGYNKSPPSRGHHIKLSRLCTGQFWGACYVSTMCASPMLPPSPYLCNGMYLQIHKYTASTHTGKYF
jgi:hypothetical protein